MEEAQKVVESEALYCTFGPGIIDHQKGRPPDFIVKDGHVDRIQCVAFSTDLTKVASGSSDETVCVWNVKTGKMISRLAGYPWQVYSVSWDGDCVIAGSHDKTVRIWNIITGDISDGIVKSPKGGVPGPRSTKPSAWSPDHGKLASPSTHEPYDIILWDYKTEKPEITMSGHTDRIISVCWSPDGRELASGSWDMTVRVWNAVTGAAVAVLTGHTDCVTSVTFSSDGSMVASGSWDKTVRLWDSKAFAGNVAAAHIHIYKYSLVVVLR
jgi:WD40 repeat protein